MSAQSLMQTEDDAQARVWAYLYRKLLGLLRRFGKEHPLQDVGDCWIDDDNLGTKQHKIYAFDLKMLQPKIISELRRLVSDFPGWEIVLAVAVRGGEDWPDMGLTIRKHEIIDGLQREYFPPEFQNLAYEGARPGTERD